MPCARVARLGDGWYPNPVSPQIFAEQSQQLDAFAREAGRDPQELHRCVYTTLNINDDAAQAERETKAFAEGYYNVPYEVIAPCRASATARPTPASPGCGTSPRAARRPSSSASPARIRLANSSAAPPTSAARGGVRRETRELCQAIRRRQGRRPEPGHRRPLRLGAAVAQGAEVIRSSRRAATGCAPRARTGRSGDMTPSFVIANLGKRSVVVDLKTTRGVAIVRGLAARSGHLHGGLPARRQSSASGSATRWWPTSTRASSTCRCPASGRKGRCGERPATDGVLQAFSGFMSANRGPDTHPAPRRGGDHRSGHVAVQPASHAGRPVGAAERRRGLLHPTTACCAAPRPSTT